MMVAVRCWSSFLLFPSLSFRLSLCSRGVPWASRVNYEEINVLFEIERNKTIVSSKWIDIKKFDDVDFDIIEKDRDIGEYVNKCLSMEMLK